MPFPSLHPPILNTTHYDSISITQEKDKIIIQFLANTQLVHTQIFSETINLAKGQPLVITGVAGYMKFL
jgi:hypothetical protein